MYAPPREERPPAYGSEPEYESEYAAQGLPAPGANQGGYAAQVDHVHYENQYPNVNPVQSHGDQFSSVVMDGGAVPGGMGSPFVPNQDKLNYQPNGPSSSCKDIAFIIAFAIHLVLMIVIAGVYGPTMLSDMKATVPSGTNTNPVSQPADTFWVGLLVVAAVIGVVFSIIWLSVMKRFSASIIKISMVAFVVMCGLGMIIAFVEQNVVMGVWFLIVAIITGVYYYFIRNRIPFASAILESSVASIQQNSGPIFVVYGLSLVQIAWLALWSFIFAAVFHAGSKVYTVQNPDGSITQTRASQSTGLQLVQTFCVFSLYWTLQVVKNIGHCTTAGVVASWWFIPSLSAPTRPAFVRAITTSFGSICFGSLLVALIQTVRFMLRQARRDACRQIVDCLLGMMENVLKWFNKYAFCVVAIYGEGFIDSAKKTGQLLKNTLFEAIINDDLSGMVLFLGSFLAGTVAGVIGIIWAYSKNYDGFAVMGIIAFIVGYLIATLAMTVISSAVTTTFVCWASDPAALLANRPVEFGRILDAGSTKYASVGLGQYSGQPRTQV